VVDERKVMDGYFPEVKMQLSEFGSVGELIQRQLSMATPMLSGPYAFFLALQERSLARIIPMADRIAFFLLLELRMEQ
jgi:hypothetical protein